MVNYFLFIRGNFYQPGFDVLQMTFKRFYLFFNQLRVDFRKLFHKIQWILIHGQFRQLVTEEAIFSEWTSCDWVDFKSSMVSRNVLVLSAIVFFQLFIFFFNILER